MSFITDMVSFVTIKKLESNIRSLNDLVQQGGRVGVLAGSYDSVWVEGNLPSIGPLVRHLRTSEECVAALRQGAVSALIEKETIALFHVYTPPW